MPSQILIEAEPPQMTKFKKLAMYIVWSVNNFLMESEDIIFHELYMLRISHDLTHFRLGRKVKRFLI